MNNLIIFNAQYLYLLAIALLAIYFFLLPKDKKKSIVILSAVYFPLTYLLAKIASFLYFDPRPFVVGHFTPLISHAPDNGFPSDHMLLVSAIASILFVYNKKLGAVAWIVAFIIGASRVLAGIHHWTDILGSAVIAVGVMWLVKDYIMKTNIINKFFKKSSK